jgi:hypothetical protein
MGPQNHPASPSWEELTESQLIGLLCRRHGWVHLGRHQLCRVRGVRG